MADSLIDIKIEGLSTLSYVNYQAEMEIKALSSNYRQNAFSFLRSITIENKSLIDYRNLDLVIRSSFLGVEISPIKISLLERGKKTLLNQFNIFINALELYKLSEAFPLTLSFELLDEEGNVLSKAYQNLKVLPIEESASEVRIPEILASYITPNDEEVKKIIAKAHVKLSEKYGRNDFATYQYHDPNKVLEEIDALYLALIDEKIAYSEPPASFNKTFQRVRLPYQVLKGKVATCLDFSLLFASMLEAVGYRPLLVLLKSHCLVGVWLDNEHSLGAYEENGTLLINAASRGFNYLSLIDVTLAHASLVASFNEAVAMGYKQASALGAFNYALDIYMCRKGRMLPIPTPRSLDGELSVDLPTYGPDYEDEGTPYVDESARRYISGEDAPTKNRFDHWLDKLLDLNLANRLINLKPTANFSQFITADVESFFKALKEHEKFNIRPFDFANYPFSETEKIIDFPPKSFDKMVSEAYKNGELYLTSRKGDVESYLKNLSRKSNTALEESGSNPLFLAIGLIRWFDNEKAASIGKGEMYAPIFLLPVKMSRRRVSSTYSFEYDYEDLTLNTTVLEYFREVYKLDFNAILNSSFKTKDGNVDVRLIYNYIRTEIAPKKGWDIIENYSYLGLFSFAHFVMWNDLKSRREELLAHPFIASLIEGKKMWDDNPLDTSNIKLDDLIKEGTLALPLPADSSQIEAVYRSLRGESFIMDGPPGTGKSQTIANMIVNFLYHHKSVLFVAEKEVALEVVKSRLDALGLGNFCLELSSVKTSKSDVLKQIGTLLDLGPLKGSEEFEVTAAKVEQLKDELNNLVKDLHETDDYFLSIQEAILLYLESIEAKGLFRVDDAYIESLTFDKYTESIKRLDEVLDSSKVNGGYLANPFLAYQNRNYSLALREKLIDDLRSLSGLDKNLELSLYNCIRKLKGVKATRKNAEILAKLTPILRNSKRFVYKHFYAPSFLDSEDLLIKYLELNEAILEKENYLEEYFSTGVYSLYVPHLKELVLSYSSSSLFKRGKYYRELYKEFKPYLSYKKVKKKVIFTSVEMLKEIEEKKTLVDALGSYPRLIYPDLPVKLEEYTLLKEGLASSIEAAHLFNELDLEEDADREKIGQMIEGYYGHYDELFEDNDNKLIRYLTERSFHADKLKNELQFDLNLYPDLDNYFASEAEKIKRVILNEGQLGAWVKFLETLDKFEELAPNGFVKEYKEGRLYEGNLKDAFNNSLAFSLLTLATSKKGIANLSGEEILNKIESYGSALNELSSYSVIETAKEISKNYPLLSEGIASSTEVYQLKKLTKNGGRGVSLRFIFSTFGELIHKLCPIFLMSPQAVAQFLKPDDIFDVTIFDEASQIPTSEAIGAISRGKSVIIAGDEEQMPPSNYFNANISSASDFENSLVSLSEDLESLLDDAIVIGLPRHRLKWHYRSSHESLIAFSNNRFYENDLFTFPSPKEKKQCVFYRYIEGDYERGRGINRVEAKALVADIISRLKDSELRKHSIGVVTFNEAQQNLILDLLEKEEGKDHALFANLKEPIFVKNLENVQGDERDVIYFSTTYGPDKKTGNLSLNFGPLSREKGERRLNVAITRSREEMIVYSSMKPSMIKAERAKNEGASYLKDFLLFAKEGTSTLANILGSASYDGTYSIAKYIAEDLRKLGYEVYIDLGTSVFRLDLAIVDPEAKDQFALGIILDGPSYINAKTSRDRNIVQPSVLKRLGWKLYRLWSLEYFDHPKEVVSSIISRLNTPIEEEEEGRNTPINFEKQNINLYPHMIPYRYADLSLPSSSSEMVRLYEAVDRLVRVEGPISFSEIADKVKGALDKGRLTSFLRSQIKICLSDLDVKKELCSTESYYYKGIEDIEEYSYYRVKEETRELALISYKELSNAFKDILAVQGKMTEADLIKQTATLFKEDVVSEKRKRHLKAAIKAAIEMHRGLYLDKDGFIHL